ncbi:glycosyl hydrolase family 3 C-terminal domain-containing protein [Xylaria grammica]|nr:glycosyl hydrolase family 3 C-terminal domain-containing protein [Xylaria grammica]
MPGVTYFRRKLVKQALGSDKLQLKDVDELVKKALPLGLPKNAEEQTIGTPNIPALLRSLSANSIVLILKNTNNVLPFRKNKTTAGIGSNARYAAYYCGGSASLQPYHAISPLGSIKSQTSHVEYALGAPAWKRLPLLSEIPRTTDGQRAEETAEYEFSISVAGTAKLFIDGKLVIDNETKQRLGGSFFARARHVRITIYNDIPEFGCGAFRRCPKVSPTEDRAQAVELAKRVYQVVLCVGHNEEWETEGFDRTEYSLPPLNDELVRAVVTANPNIVVVFTEKTFTPAIDYKRKSAEKWLFPFVTGSAIITSFDIHDLKIAERTGVNNEDEISVTVTVTNTDSVAGAYVAQVYVFQHNQSINRPLKELKGFEKVFLNPRETKDVGIPLNKKYATSFWDEALSSWILEKVTFLGCSRRFEY